MRWLNSEYEEKATAEFDILTRLEGHAGIVKVENFYSLYSSSLLVMELLEGMTIKEYVERRNRKPTPEK